MVVLQSIMETINDIQMTEWLELKARNHERRREFREAIQSWKKLLELLTHAPKTEGSDVTHLALIHYHLGMNHQALKDNMKSIYHLKYSIRLNSSEPRYYQAFGKAYLRGGHWQVAKTQFEKAVRLEPGNASYLRQYSWVLLMMGRKSEARYYAKMAYEISQKDSKNQWCYVRALMESKNYLKAAQMLRGISCDPDSKDRVKYLLTECVERADEMLDGAVVRYLRAAMKFDGKPFHLGHYRSAEALWIRFCAFERPSLAQSSSLQSYAAAIAWVSLERGALQPMDFGFEDLLLRFSADSTGLWPILKRVRAFAEIGQN